MFVFTARGYLQVKEFAQTAWLSATSCSRLGRHGLHGWRTRTLTRWRLVVKTVHGRDPPRKGMLVDHLRENW